MKLLKIILAVMLLPVVAGLVYMRANREEWQTPKRCADCAVLDVQRQQRLIGTVEILSNGKILFTDQLTGLTYNLISCDAICGGKDIPPLSKAVVMDNDTKEQIYCDIEGVYFPGKDCLIYSSYILLKTRKFVSPQEIKEVAFDTIKAKYTPLEEEIFLLSESHYAGLRGFLLHYFSKELLSQPIPIKEATWETSDSTLITVWFEQKPVKQNKWTLIESYQWKKGMEF